VETALFRPHTFLLKRYCDFFRDLLDLKSPTVDEDIPPPGSDDEHPLILETIHLKDGIALNSNVVLQYYDRSIIENPPRGFEEWSLVLDTSYRWQSPWMRRFAIKRLDENHIEPSIRMKLAVDYDIEDWLRIAYKGICRRQCFLTSQDLALIPTSKVVDILRTRESL
ncbi:hypothetical protein DL93DRAFT_2045992, partial [Clavulina sp. PMI_390]